MSKDKKFALVRVTLTEDYFIPMINDDKTEINGWSLTQVIKDWFLDWNPSHATRNGHCIGNSRKYISSEVVWTAHKEEEN
jgi:hypothetical protein